MNEFQELQDKADSIREANDCGVKAVAVAAEIGYLSAWKACADLGRKRRGGTYTHIILKAIENNGKKVEQIKPLAKTVRGLEKNLFTGIYLCLVKGGKHIVAVKNGKAIDWTANRCHRICKMWKVEPAFFPCSNKPK
jgi:uncharacterized protein (UPF0264 family)